MAILGNKNSLIEDEIEEKDKYTIPAVIRQDEKEMSLKKYFLFMQGKEWQDKGVY